MKNVYSIVSLIWTRVQLLYSLLLLKSFLITMDTLDQSMFYDFQQWSWLSLI